MHGYAIPVPALRYGTILISYWSPLTSSQLSHFILNAFFGIRTSKFCNHQTVQRLVRVKSQDRADSSGSPF